MAHSDEFQKPSPMEELVTLAQIQEEHLRRIAWWTRLGWMVIVAAAIGMALK